MATYAALVSLMYTIEQIQQHPCPPISLDKKQVESLTEKITFLQDFLEVYNYHVHDYGLENRILDATHAAEDVIETRIVDQILHQSTSQEKNINSNALFYQDLQKVIHDMDFIKKEVMEIKEKRGSVQDHLHKRSSKPETASSRSSPSIIVGFDDVQIQLMDKLTGQRSSSRQIIPIVGMGGIGKTTLAKNIYEHPTIVEYFDVRAWATISQEYSAREILSQLLSCLEKGSQAGGEEGDSQAGGEEGEKLYEKLSEQELGDKLYKKLCGRRYLIIMDDMWSIEACDKVKFLFPNEKNGSRIVITSRISKMAEQLIGGHGLEMNFLNKDVSWSLLCNVVFGEGGCPLELEETGKKIAENCKGLPLSLVVIGGLLAKSNRTPEYWEYIAKNLNSIVNLENNAHCLNLLYLSYNHLSVHLKPCFLYFGLSRKGHKIFVHDLIDLWVAEGFLKPISGKSLEDVAKEYIEELLDRNLILVSRRAYHGKATSLKIHDLLRDLCSREAEKEKFFCVTRQHSHNILPHGLNTQRRIALRDNTPVEAFLTSLQSASNARSLIFGFEGGLPSSNFRLLRVLLTKCGETLEAAFSQSVNLRFFSVAILSRSDRLHLSVPSSFYLLWNLHTLVVKLPLNGLLSLDICKMPQLRHADIESCSLSKTAHALMHGQGDFILKNLHFLGRVWNFPCSEKMVKRIPNIKTLKISYGEKRFIRSYCSLNNLVLLEKLEELSCVLFSPVESINRSDLLHNLTFPHSLKELILSGSRLPWKDISTKIGSSPYLQGLALGRDSFVGPEWETSEGQFCSLKFLHIAECKDLECWKTDNTHFPRLERLFLEFLPKLREMPHGIGDITTLQLIKISYCSDSVIFSAKEILKEQEEVGNEGLRVRATILQHNEEVESLASHNFSVKVP